MKTITILSLIAVFLLSCNDAKLIGDQPETAQQAEVKYYADTEAAIRKYREDSQKYWDRKDSVNALKYQDSIKSAIINTYLQDYNFATVDGSVLNTKEKKKPLFLHVTASWCAPCKAEIPSLNQVAEQYKDKVDFVFLFWDTKEELLQFSSEYSTAIALVPSQAKQEEPATISIAGFRHITGFPTNYLVASDKRIINFSQGAVVPRTYTDKEGNEVTITKDMAERQNYERLEGEIRELLAEEQALTKLVVQ